MAALHYATAVPKGETLVSTHTKLVLISIWVRGQSTAYMVSGTFDTKTGKTVVSSDIVKECCKKAGVRDGEIYSIGM